MTKVPALAVLLPALLGCPIRAGAEPPLEPRTTDAAIALRNLNATVDGLAADLAAGRLATERFGELVDGLLQRAQFLSTISDMEKASEVADRFVREAPQLGKAWLARGRVRAALHRFTEAERDFAEAEKRGTDVDAARAAVLQATGRFPAALAIRERQARELPRLDSLGTLAILLGEMGRLDEAEATFIRALDAYRDVSPFAVAWLHFRHGLVWLEAGHPERAQPLFTRAVAHLPFYAAAVTHLAEAEAAEGRHAAAIARLTPLAARCEDPDSAAQLARILGEAGAHVDAERWRARAAAGFEALLARHPEAFADHAAEFWLAAGADPARALTLARRNLEQRPTPRASRLLAQAEAALGRRPDGSD